MKKNPLQFALEFEQKGTAMYLVLASQTENPLGKTLFYSLAAEEVEHAHKIDFKSQELAKKSGTSVLDNTHLPAVAEVIKTFFKNADKKHLRGDVSNVSGYEHAMKMEREGYAAYKEFSINATTAEEKEFFAFLLSQEKQHIDAIANVYAYLTGSGDLLQVDESKTWNWMNL
ncbi:MAG: ferritin family protein [Endomicrobiales bacterium]|jgi:rubrerythrin